MEYFWFNNVFVVICFVVGRMIECEYFEDPIAWAMSIPWKTWILIMFRTNCLCNSRCEFYLNGNAWVGTKLLLIIFRVSAVTSDRFHLAMTLALAFSFGFGFGCVHTVPSRTWSSLVLFAWRCSFGVCMFLRLANGLVAGCFCCCCCCWEWVFGDDAILLWNFRLNHSMCVCVCVIRPTKESELFLFSFVCFCYAFSCLAYTHTQ